MRVRDRVTGSGVGGWWPEEPAAPQGADDDRFAPGAIAPRANQDRFLAIQPSLPEACVVDAIADYGHARGAVACRRAPGPREPAQYSCRVGRNRISLMSTSSGWLMAKATARANDALRYRAHVE